MRPVQVVDSTNPVPGRLPANTREALAGPAALGRSGAEDLSGDPGDPGSERRLDADALAVLRSLQPDAAAKLELATPGAQSAERGTASFAGTAELERRGGRRLAAAAAVEGPGFRSRVGSLDAARARAAAVAAWWREVSAGQATAPRQANEPDQAHARPQQRRGPASARGAPASAAAAAAAGSWAIAGEERRFRDAAAAAGVLLPGTFTDDFEEVRHLAGACIR